MRIELLGQSNKKNLEEKIKIVSTAGRLSRYEGTVFDILEKFNDYEKNINLIKRIIKMGHESITDHDYLVFAIQDVSPIIEQTIIEERYSSFTIKSRREVNFSQVGYYIPSFKDESGNLLSNQEELKEKYCNHMKYLFDSYQKIVDLGIPVEDARFVLPYSYHSNIIMGIDAHTLKRMIVDFTKGIKSNIDEIKEFGQELYQIMCANVPYYKEIIDEVEESKIDKTKLILDEYAQENYKILDKPILLNNFNNIDETIIISALIRRYQYSYNQAKAIYDKIDSSTREQLMHLIYNGDQKELTQVSFQFEIPISLAILTHITRHRSHTPIIPDFVPVHDLKQYQTPLTIKNKCLDLYDEIYDKNYEVYNEFKNLGIREEDLIYFHLSGNMVNILTNIDGKTLAWISRLRICNKAQWEIRAIFTEIRKIVKEIAPIYSSILGPDCETRRVCHEGKESCGKIKYLKGAVCEEK